MSLFLGVGWTVLGFLFGFTVHNAAAMIGCFVLSYLWMNHKK